MADQRRGALQAGLRAPEAGGPKRAARSGSPQWDTPSHIRVVRPARTFRHHPGDVLSRILDVAGLAVHAVLGVDGEGRLAVLLHHFIHPSRAVALGWLVVLRQVLADRDGWIGQLQVTGLVFLVIGVREEHAGKLVEGQLAVRLRVLDLLRAGRRLQGRMIRVWILQCERHFPARQLIHEDEGGTRQSAELVDCLLGVFSALTVPLFLNMVSSNLLTVAHKKPVNLFIFNGICLLFALFSCRLKENVLNKRFRVAGRKTRDPDTTDTVETDHEVNIGGRKMSENRLGRTGISETELKILQVMASGTAVHQTLVGLMKDPELEKEPVNETLSFLMAKGLVEQKLNAENKLRLYLTPKAKQILDKFDKNRTFS